MVSTSARILVADDQPDVLEALRWLLTGEGYDAELVDSTDAVIERLGAGTFDLVLMDLNYSRDTTSGREGLALIPRIRTHDPALPIVVMTGWGSIDTAVEAMRLGAKSFVQKPWDDAALREIVGREIDEGRAARRQDRKRDREREEAKMIQRALLPTTLPQIPGIDVATAWLPADGVGGDCYDMLASGTLLGIAIADVAGKGLPAALLMSNLQAAVRAFAQNAAEPAALCGNLNRLLCRHMVSGRFVTFCFAWLRSPQASPGAHASSSADSVSANQCDAAFTIQYCNAGHNPPLIVRANGDVERLGDGGTVLGVFAEAAYQQSTVQLNPGDRLLFFTDGITEARNPAGEEFGDERLARVASESDATSAEALKDRILDVLHAFTGGTFDDDATLIVVAGVS